MFDLETNREIDNDTQNGRREDSHYEPNSSEDRNSELHSDAAPGEAPWYHRMPGDSIWASWQGATIMTFGVVLPSLIIVSGLVACYDRVVLLLLKQPVETLAETALLLCIPLANLTIWSALCKQDVRHTIRRGILNGIGIGASAFIALFTGAAATLRFPTVSEAGVPHVTEFAIISALSILAMTIGINLAIRVRGTRITRSSKSRAASFVACGILISLVGFIASEARSTCIRVAEYLATSDSVDEKTKGLDLLKALNPEKEIRMECSSRKAGGLPGLFVRVDNDTLRQLHFAITGKTFGDEQSQNFANMTDEYLKNHVVGDPVKGLSLHKSAMFGQVNPATVSSTIYWTFVFKNKNYEPQEARAEIGLPEGAVISGMTVWKDGRPMKTEFQPTGEQVNSGWSNIGHDAPGIVTDLGRGRMLLHCYPVPAQGFLRMSVAVTVPLKLHTVTDASLALPRFIETNFDLKGNHSVRIISDDDISLATKGIVSENTNGQHFIDGELTSEVLEGAGLSVRVKRPAVFGPITIRDNNRSPAKYLVQTIRELPAVQPKQLVVVLDASESMKPHVQGLKRVLSNLPPNIKASLVVASQASVVKPRIVSMKKGLADLTDRSFSGGQDNLEAVIKATSVAGEAKDGAVLWIHGPQPGYNNEIYIMSPYMYAPSFYELALDDGVMDASEYFKNHREIGPFTQIARSASIDADLERFLSKWKPGGHDYLVEYQVLNSQPNGAKLANDSQTQETTALFAKEKVSQYLRAGQTKDATALAVYHRIVTPVSLASCAGLGESLESERLAMEHGTRNIRIVDSSAGTTAAATPENPSYIEGYTPLTNDTSSPNTNLSYGATTEDQTTLQGATNGTIGPQCVSYMGVNTAGTVRVNNLANLEALLNIFANLIEVLGIGFGASILISSAFALPKDAPSLLPWGRLSQQSRFAVGLALTIGGLITPGFINYMVASARDANLFS